ALQGTFDARIVLALKAAAESAKKSVAKLAGKQGIGAAVRRAQLTQAETALHGVLAALFLDVGKIVEAGEQKAAELALSVGFNWDEVLLRAVYGNDTQQLAAMRRALIAQAPRNVEALIMRLRGGGLPLSQQVYKTNALAQGWVNAAINNALGRG